jgi:hypothetical protein
VKKGYVEKTTKENVPISSEPHLASQVQMDPADLDKMEELVAEAVKEIGRDVKTNSRTYHDDFVRAIAGKRMKVKTRVVTNCGSYLNTFAKKWPSKYRTPIDIAKAMKKGYWMASRDVKGAYLHIRVADASTSMVTTTCMMVSRWAPLLPVPSLAQCQPS